MKYLMHGTKNIKDYLIKELNEILMDVCKMFIGMQVYLVVPTYSLGALTAAQFV